MKKQTAKQQMVGTIKEWIEQNESSAGVSTQMNVISAIESLEI